MLMKKTKVKEHIAHLEQLRAERNHVTQDRIIRELAAIAFGNAADYAQVVEKPMLKENEDGMLAPVYDADGNPVLVRTVEPTLTGKLSIEQQRALTEIRKGKDGFVVKPYDKLRALELLGKQLGMFADKVEVDDKRDDPFEHMSTEELKALAAGLTPYG